jgi:hypothetical protein
VVYKLRNTNITKRSSGASPCKTYCGTTWLSRTRSSIWPLTSTRQPVHPTLNLFTCFQHQERSSYVWMSISHKTGVQERLRRSAHRGRPDGVQCYPHLLLKCRETVALLYEIVSIHSAEFNNVDPGGGRNWHRKPRWSDRVIWPNCRQWRTERGGGFRVFKPPPHKFRWTSKIVPNPTRFVKTVKNC